MRRKDREVTDIRQIESIIEKAKVVHIGMIDDGVPYVVPMQYGYVFTDGALTLYLHSAQEGRKIDCIKKKSERIYRTRNGHYSDFRRRHSVQIQFRICERYG